MKTKRSKKKNKKIKKTKKHRGGFKCCPIEAWVDKSRAARQKIRNKKRKYLLKKFKDAAKTFKLSSDGKERLMQELYNNYPKIFPDLAEDKKKSKKKI